MKIILMLNKIIIVIIFSQFILGQKAQSKSPYTQANKVYFDNQKIILPELNHDELIEEDFYREPGTAFRYGYKFNLEYTTLNSGTWENIKGGGRIWKITLISTGAYAIGLDFKEFNLPEGSELYVYNPNYEMIHGAYTFSNNSKSYQFSTPLLKGDTVIIEYYNPRDNKENPFIISELVHDYRDIMNYENNQRDWECGINVICETDEIYQGAINSVAFLDMGGFICSGVMVNNARQDLTPYFLTAWHCIDGDNPSTFRFYFNKKASSCENTWGSAGEYAYSSELIADSDGITGGDWALLLINDDIQEDWEVFYAGWDVTGDYPIISSGIHHPGGTPKKINYENDIAYGAYWDSPADGLTHWQVNFDQGGTEGGSSGSPIFNDRFRIVGVLTGGSGGCGDPYPSLYGKLSLAWNWEMPMNRRLIDWLDPDYTGTLVVDGTYEIVVGITGDLNADNSVNILDIIQLANLILSDTFSDSADLNNDNTLNILDIISLVNIILAD